MTIYKKNYNKGKADRASGSRAKMPNTLLDLIAFGAYVAGYTGKEYKEPKPLGVIFPPEHLESENLIGKEGY